MKTIYKSCTPGVTNEQFERFGCSGVTTFASYARLIDKSIKEAIVLQPTEKIKGMAITEDGITFYL